MPCGLGEFAAWKATRYVRGSKRNIAEASERREGPQGFSWLWTMKIPLCQ